MFRKAKRFRKKDVLILYVTDFVTLSMLWNRYVVKEFMAGHQVVIANQCWFADVYLAIEATIAFLNEHKIYPGGLDNCFSVEILPSYYNRRVDYWKKGNNHYKPRLSAPNLSDAWKPSRPSMQAQQRPACRGQERRKVCPHFYTVSVNSDINIYKRLVLR